MVRSHQTAPPNPTATSSSPILPSSSSRKHNSFSPFSSPTKTKSLMLSGNCCLHFKPLHSRHRLQKHLHLPSFLPPSLPPSSFSPSPFPATNSQQRARSGLCDDVLLWKGVHVLLLPSSGGRRHRIALRFRSFQRRIP